MRESNLPLLGPEFELQNPEQFFDYIVSLAQSRIKKKAKRLKPRCFKFKQSRAPKKTSWGVYLMTDPETNIEFAFQFKKTDEGKEIFGIHLQAFMNAFPGRKSSEIEVALKTRKLYFPLADNSLRE